MTMHKPVDVQPEGWPVVRNCEQCETAWPCQKVRVHDVLSDVLTEIAIAEIPDDRVPQQIIDELADRGYVLAQVR